MTMLQLVLSTLIRNGKVTVETPNLDMDELRKVVQNGAEQKLREIEGIVFEEEMTDGEKVRYLQDLLEQRGCNPVGRGILDAPPCPRPSGTEGRLDREAQFVAY